MNTTRIGLFAALLLIGLLAACGASGTTGDPASGQKLFSGATPISGGNAPACVTCHAVEPGSDTGVGQNLSNIGNRAATAVPGQPAEEYLRTAIVDPDAYLSGGYQEGIMYRGYGQDLSPQQVRDLVAYLLTLKSGQDS
jgi:cytochrome c2